MSGAAAQLNMDVMANNTHTEIPNRYLRRKRVPMIKRPRDPSKEITFDQWQEEQDKKQRAHTAKFIENRNRKVADLKQLQKRMDAAPPNPGEPKGFKERLMIPPTIKVPSRGPKTDSGNKVIDDGEVPVRKVKVKRTSKVLAARERSKRAHGARLEKVLSDG